MRIAFMGASGTGKSTLAKWLVGPDGPEVTRGLPICPVGSRSTAKAMGFVGPDGEGRPYDVDRADLGQYLDVLNREDPVMRFGAVCRDAALSAMEAWHNGMSHMGKSCRPLFQRKLAEDKIAWESQTAVCDCNGGRPYPGQAHRNSCPVAEESYRLQTGGKANPRAFVTDRTPLDDCAYAMVHCPEVVDAEFLRRATLHTSTYDLIFFCPLEAFQATAGDTARRTDAAYHLRYEIVLRGLWMYVSRNYSLRVVFLQSSAMEERQEYLLSALSRSGHRQD